MSPTNEQAPVPVPEAQVAPEAQGIPMPTAEQAAANLDQKAPQLRMMPDGSIATEAEVKKAIDAGQDMSMGAYGNGRR